MPTSTRLNYLNYTGGCGHPPLHTQRVHSIININPIKLQISPNQKGDPVKKTKSGKALIKKYAAQYNTLFDDND